MRNRVLVLQFGNRLQIELRKANGDHYFRCGNVYTQLSLAANTARQDGDDAVPPNPLQLFPEQAEYEGCIGYFLGV